MMRDRVLLAVSVPVMAVSLGAWAIVGNDRATAEMGAAPTELPAPRLAGRGALRAHANASLERLAGARAVLANRGRPFDALPIPALAFSFAGSSADRARAIECLAAAAYYEAGDDPDAQRAVVQVVLNRVRNPRYPATVCGVVFQGHMRQSGCQFTFTCDGSMRRVPSVAAWDRARFVAAAGLAGSIDQRVGNATHYHADYVVPYWSGELSKVAVVGAHIFYRSRMQQVQLAAQRPGTAEPEIAALAPLQNRGAVWEGRDSTSSADKAEPAIFAAQPERPVAEPAVLAQDPTHLLLAAGTRTAGRFAVEALNLCRGQQDCRVLGYPTEEALARNRAKTWRTRERPAFMYVRDASGFEFAMWDCAKTPRTEQHQCLPTADAMLNKMMQPGPAAQIALLGD